MNNSNKKIFKQSICLGIILFFLLPLAFSQETDQDPDTKELLRQIQAEKTNQGKVDSDLLKKVVSKDPVLMASNPDVRGAVGKEAARDISILRGSDPRSGIIRTNWLQSFGGFKDEGIQVSKVKIADGKTLVTFAINDDSRTLFGVRNSDKPTVTFTMDDFEKIKTITGKDSISTRHGTVIVPIRGGYHINTGTITVEGNSLKLSNGEYLPGYSLTPNPIPVKFLVKGEVLLPLQRGESVQILSGSVLHIESSDSVVRSVAVKNGPFNFDSMMEEVYNCKQNCIFTVGDGRRTDLNGYSIKGPNQIDITVASMFRSLTLEDTDPGSELWIASSSDGEPFSWDLSGIGGKVKVTSLSGGLEYFDHALYYSGRPVFPNGVTGIAGLDGRSFSLFWRGGNPASLGTSSGRLGIIADGIEKSENLRPLIS